MSLGEFDLIAKYFDRPARRNPLGVGDDCALLAPAPGMQLAVSTDMLVEGRHFLPTVSAEALGHKALAVNLSDLAACGAEPLAFMLALSMPKVDEAWLAGLARGLFALADAHEIELVGGDTTAGPLNLCITVMGQVPAGTALLRSGARPGDQLWVSGQLGLARLWLEALHGPVALDGTDFTAARLAMELPNPRLALGRALRGIASSALDLSDGLLGDLGHVLRRSGAACHRDRTPLGAEIEIDRLPRHEALARQPEPIQQLCMLCGGDDYELLFTAPPGAHGAVLEAAAAAQTAVTCVGRITPEPGTRVIDRNGAPIATPWASFDHFAGPTP
ncbi:thiamine-monophosphate kinase [Leptothrix cholodnii SP-6]|uniref:Thiamine-monophosphate kinase n=1 Tax=Leptothrix cholodnii (strain ATCC 51168 / LMG 8142 / SP-6) TaxID=395495 RepID=B1Y7M5_LEPCP|nr:thiamine-monophosphate kinase [Leptothrix cholodnii SP-6]